MMEAGVVLDRNNQPIAWHLPPGRSVAYLPDSNELWEIFWNNRASISGYAHSHPGGGIPRPSHTDITTFAAIESALGIRLDWWIISNEDVSLVKWIGPDKYDYSLFIFDACDHADAPWVDELREVSYYQQEEE
jgi:hypothetical protein